MTQLFEQFLSEADQFVTYGRKANMKFSDYEKYYQPPTDGQLKKWVDLVDDVEKHKIMIKEILDKGVEENLVDLDIELETFRDLSRRMDDNYCYWSAYYNDIDKVMDRMYDTVTDIDEKYDIGK